MILGWKLAGISRKEAESERAPVDLTLPETYETKRQPIRGCVLDRTQAQVAILQPDPHAAANPSNHSWSG